MPALLILIVTVLSGCAGVKLESHDFPKEVSSRMLAERCDCDIFEFVEATGGGFVLEDGAEHIQYHVAKTAFEVDVDFISSNLVSLILGQPTFSEVRQTVELLNPFDAQEYTINGVSDNKGMRIVVALKAQADAGTVGKVTANNAATIYGHVYRLQERRWWDDVSDVISVAGKTIFREYAGGGYLRISDEAGDEARIFQGEVLGETPMVSLESMYMDYGKSLVFLPRGKDSDYRRDIFLFYHAIDFFQAFLADIQTLPECLANDQKPEKCPELLWVY